MDGDYKSNIYFAISDGHGNQLTLGENERRLILPALFAVAFQNNCNCNNVIKMCALTAKMMYLHHVKIW